MSLPVTQDQSQYLDNKEHDSLFVAKRVTEVGNDSTNLMDYDGRSDDNPVYVGQAARGVAESDPGWLVRKNVYDDVPVTRIVSTTAAVGSWTARVSLF